MKLIQLLQITLIIYLCVSYNTVECIRNTRVRRQSKSHKLNLIKKSHRLNIVKNHRHSRFYKVRQSLKAAQKLGASIRLRILSNNPLVEAKFQALWTILKTTKDFTEEVKSNMDTLQDEITTLYDTAKKVKGANVSAIDAEEDELSATFHKARLMVIEAVSKKALSSIKNSQTEAKSTVTCTLAEKKIVESATESGIECPTSLTQTKMSVDEQKEHFVQQIKSQQEIIKQMLQKVPAYVTSQQVLLTENRKYGKGLAEAIQNSVPEGFCWRSQTKIPSSCPSTHPERSMALCYEKCEPGRVRKSYASKISTTFAKDWANTCWEQCPGNIQCRVKGLVIVKTQSEWHWRRSFIPRSLTNFNANVLCDTGFHKWGAICIRDKEARKTCPQLGYKNCGPGACAIDTPTCVSEIASMIFETFVGLSKFALLFIAPGAAPALEMAKQIVEFASMAKEFVTKFALEMQQFKKVAKNEILKAKMVQDALKYLQDNQLNKKGSTVVGDVIVTKDLNDLVDEKLKKLEISDVLTDGFAGARDLAAGILDSALEELFQKQPLASLVAGVMSCGASIGEVTTSLARDKMKIVTDCGDVVIGLVAALDPTGIVQIVQAFAKYGACQDD